MVDQERPPPLPEKHRIPIRIVVVVAAYALYYAVEDTKFSAAVFLGLGTLLVGWTIADRLTVWRHQRSGLLMAGGAILGLGLLALGAIGALG